MALRFDSGPNRDVNPIEQPVNNVSEIKSDSDFNQKEVYDAMMKDLSGTQKQTPQTLDDFMNRIAYHESAGTMDPTLHQYGGGTGRGLFQFETGAGQGGATAMTRLRNYLQRRGQSIPEWANFDESQGVDASKLSPEQQRMLFMANLREHKHANLRGVTPSTLGTEYWAPYHWAGPGHQRDERLRSWDESMAAYDLKNKPTAEEEAFGSY